MSEWIRGKFNLNKKSSYTSIVSLPGTGKRVLSPKELEKEGVNFEYNAAMGRYAAPLTDEELIAELEIKIKGGSSIYDPMVREKSVFESLEPKKKRFKVTFKYYMNMPEFLHDKTLEISAFNTYGAQVEVEKNYPHVSKFVATEI